MRRAIQVTTHSEYWGSYYRGVFENGQSWLDYSNDRVQAQTFGLVLEAAGPVGGKRCVDIGCGWGQFARMLHDLGATEVTGIDLVGEPIAQLARDFPEIRWLRGNLLSGEVAVPRHSADLVFLIEVLQYMPFGLAIETAWDLVAPGGRLVAVVPNAECPIVSRTKERFDARYAPPSADDVRQKLDAFVGVERWACRGLTFGGDQRIAPYDVTAWSEAPSWSQPPNRLQFVVIKAE
jgi:SAM-dependent methyltransferase